MDPFAHITLPLLILLALRVKTRKALLMLPLTLILDFGFFFRGLHRMVFHNVFVAVLIPLVILIYIYRYHSKYESYAFIAFFYLVSHVILDLGKGMAFLYPLTTDFYYFEMQLFFQFLGPIPIPDPTFDFGVIVAEDTAIVGGNMGPKETASQYPSVSNISSGLLFTLIIAAVMYYQKAHTFLDEIRQLLLDIKEEIYEKLKSIGELIKSR